MASRTWSGGTTARTQVDTLTIANTWASADTMTTTLLAEDGSTSTNVLTSVLGASLESNRDLHLLGLKASTSVLLTGLTFAASVPVGMEPVAVAARTNDEVWVVNHLSDSISIVDVGGAVPIVSAKLRQEACQIGAIKTE